MIEDYLIRDSLRESFKGYGRALRRQDDPPLDGEPWMSMHDAVDQGTYAMLKLLAEKGPDVERGTITVISLGLIVAAIAFILYFMKLPIFTTEAVAWTFVVALTASGVAAAGLIVNSIWGRK